jgi:hypothetical protein
MGKSKYPRPTGRISNDFYRAYYDVWHVEPSGIKWLLFWKWSEKNEAWTEYIEPHYPLPLRNEVRYRDESGKLETIETNRAKSRVQT